jgi:KaiC/GvpD/RAD55 family RecA-like ATPase
VTMRPVASYPCHHCHGPVDVPQRGWQAPDPIYCSKHHDLVGYDAETIITTALADAEFALDTDMTGVPRWPWRAVHALAGPLGPGTITYLAAFPGNGKTSFLGHAIWHWLSQGLRVFHMPLEATPREFVVRLLCADLKLDADDALSLRLMERAQQGDPAAVAQREQLRAAYQRVVVEPGPIEHLVIEPAGMLSAAQFKRACRVAVKMGADVIVVDHVDHIGQTADDTRNEIAISRDVQHTAHQIARDAGIPFVLASQLNSSRTGGDPLAHYRPPRPDWLWNKGVKEQVATNILGLYRPMRTDLTDDQRRNASRGILPAAEVAARNQMGVASMKLRYGGAMKDSAAILHYERGTITDLAPSDRLAVDADRHGIATQPWWGDR